MQKRLDEEPAYPRRGRGRVQRCRNSKSGRYGQPIPRYCKNHRRRQRGDGEMGHQLLRRALGDSEIREPVASAEKSRKAARGLMDYQLR